MLKTIYRAHSDNGKQSERTDNTFSEDRTQKALASLIFVPKFQDHSYTRS